MSNTIAEVKKPKRKPRTNYEKQLRELKDWCVVSLKAYQSISKLAPESIAAIFQGRIEMLEDVLARLDNGK